METKKYAVYIRVSTHRQGLSGLGLEAQREICSNYISQQGGVIAREFYDIESGTHRDRKGLWAAIDFCKKNNCTLVIAKLDRLSRDVEFTFKIINTKIDIYFCDMPMVNTMILGVFASVAQYERELVSSRTKAALQAKKAQGGLLGRASENYKEDESRQTAGRCLAGITRTKNTLMSADFRCFCRSMRDIFTKLSQSITDEADMFMLGWSDIKMQDLGVTQDNITSLIRSMQNSHADNPDLFAKYDLSDVNNSNLRHIVRCKINNTLATIRNYKLQQLNNKLTIN
jgi:DNA invertase Pin-like site-specific DNA recombinase